MQKGGNKVFLYLGNFAVISSLLSFADAAEITHFEIADENVMITFTSPDDSGVSRLLLPTNSYVLNASFDAKAINAANKTQSHPMNPAVFIDNSTIWAFNGSGYGAMGYQTVFRDGGNITLGFSNDQKTNTTSIILPKNSTIVSATLDIDCGRDYRHDLVTSYNGAPQQLFGYSVACINDINKDGYGDIIAGSGSDIYQGRLGFPNNAFIFLGGNQMNLSPDYAMVPSRDFEEIFPVATLGDINNDGYDDSIIGSPYNKSSPRAFVFLGGPSINQSPDFTLLSPPNATTPFFGVAVGGAGDINNDSYDDLIVTDGNCSFIYFGGRQLNTSSATVLRGGYSPANIGDINSDGYSDICIGAPMEKDKGGNDTGAVFIYFGGILLNSTPDILIYGPPNDMEFGWSVSSAGDFNGDGFLDMVIGAPIKVIDHQSWGASYIYFGSPQLNDSYVLLRNGVHPLNYYGTSSSLAKDVNKDGYDDVLVGGSGFGTSGYPGHVSVILGAPDISDSKEMILREGADSDEFGGSVSGGSDINGDGYPDIVVGATTNRDGGMGAGKIYVFNGSSIAKVMIDPKIRIGDRFIWNGSGVQFGVRKVPDFTDALNEYLSQVPVEFTDSFGNSFAKIILDISVYSGIGVTLEGLNIIYNYSARINDFSFCLNSFIKTHAYMADKNGMVTVPLLLTSETEGVIMLSSLKIVIDEPPIIIREIPDLTIDEDSTNTMLLDIQDYFKDDYDSAKDLVYSIASIINGSYRNVSIDSNKYLSVKLFDGSGNENWTGEIIIVLRAVDEIGLETVSNEFRLTVKNVNDPPIIISNPVLEGLSGITYYYKVFVIDGDNDSLKITLDQSPEGMTIDVTKGSIVWIPELGGDYDITINASDGITSTYQNYTIRINQANRPPIIVSTPLNIAVVGSPYRYNISAIDPDNDTLVFSLTRAPIAMTIDSQNGNIMWSPKRNQTGIANGEVSVSDGKGGVVNQQFNITVIMKHNTVPPYPITIEQSGFIFLVVIITAICSTLVLTRHGKSNKR